MDQAELNFGRLALEVAEKIATNMKEKKLSKPDDAEFLCTCKISNKARDW